MSGEQLPATQLAILSGVRVGMWSSRAHQGHWMLILPYKDLFVLIVETGDPSSTPAPQRRFVTGGTSALLRQLGAHSPFRSKIYKNRGCAFAFEMPFNSICGMDYSHPLIQPGRLVLEAKDVRKREFLSLDDAFDYYSGSTAAEATPASMAALFDGSSPHKRPGQNVGVDRGVSTSTQGIGGGGVTQTPAVPLSPELGPVQQRARINLLKRLGNALVPNRSNSSQSLERRNSCGNQLRSSPSPDVAPSTSASTSTMTAAPLATSAATPSSLKATLTPESTPPPPQRPPPIKTSCSFSPASPAATTLYNGSLNGSINNQGLLSLSTVAPTAAPTSLGPPVHAFTGTARVYDFRMITVYWTDPHFPGVLRPVIENHERMLKLYESGLPAWSIFLPAYGLFYRPWLRTFTWAMFYVFSFLSLAAGFWDLYKTLPGLQALLSRMVAGVWLPPAAVLQWIEEHAQIRLSLLLTYLFGKSEMFVYVVRVLGNITRIARTSLEPLVLTLGPPASALRQAAIAAYSTGAGVIYTSLAPFLALLEWVSLGVVAVVAPPLQAAHALIVVPTAWIIGGARHINAAGSVLWTGLMGAGQAVATGVSAAKATAKVGQAAGGTAVATSSWLVWLAPADALEAVRGSLMQAARSGQSVWKFVVHLCASIHRHRVTLSRRAGRWWRRIKLRAGALAWVPAEWLLVLMQWLIVGLRMFKDALAEASKRKFSLRSNTGSNSKESLIIGRGEGEQAVLVEKNIDRTTQRLKEA